MKKILIILFCSFSTLVFSQKAPAIYIDNEGKEGYWDVKALIPSGIRPIKDMGKHFSTPFSKLEFYKVDADGYWEKMEDNVYDPNWCEWGKDCKTEDGKLIVWLTKGFRYAYCYSHWEDQTPIEIIPFTKKRFKAN